MGSNPTLSSISLGFGVTFWECANLVRALHQATLSPRWGSMFYRVGTDWANRDLHFRRFVGWASEHGVTPWIGEAECYETVPDRVGWFRTVAALAKAHQVQVCWWGLR